METQGGGQYQQTRNEESKSPDRGKSKLQLPLSCDPPGPTNPTKQLVWIVSYRLLPLCTISLRQKSVSRLNPLHRLLSRIGIRSAYFSNATRSAAVPWLTLVSGLRKHRAYGQKPHSSLSKPRRPGRSRRANVRKHL